MRNSEISSVLEQLDILEKNRLDPYLARILITELVWGKKQLNSECKPVKTVLSYEKQLRDLLESTSLEPKRKLVQKGNYLFCFQI